MVQIIAQQCWWNAPGAGRVHANMNVVHGHWLYVRCKYVTWSCPAKPGMSKAGNSSIKHSEKERQELLWREYFLDPTLWWDNRRDKKNSRSPDFRHKESREVLWLDNVYKPAWVKFLLATWDMQVEVGMTGPLASTALLQDPNQCSIAGYQGDLTAEACSRRWKEPQLTEAVASLDLLVETGHRVPTSLFCSVLKKCLTHDHLALGRRVHELAVKGGNQSNPYLANALLRFYASHGRLSEAREVFAHVTVPDTFMWFSIISAHAQLGEPTQAIELYHQMRRLSSVKPNSYLFVAALKACATSVDLVSGRQVHAEMLESGIVMDIYLGSALVDMYAKCGNLEDARRIFDGLPMKDVVTWTAMIAGYTEHGLGQEALALYWSMELEGVVRANPFTFACLLKACANIGAIQQGKQLHLRILERELEADLVVGSCLVDMYARCGRLEEASSVFENLPEKNVITWTAMLNGYGRSNWGQQAIQCFQEMLQYGVSPNEATFICLLVACSHGGLVKEGRQYFGTMVDNYSIVPTRQLYTCMADLLGRSGHVDEAENLLLSMPFESERAGWTSLLNACRSHGDVERARRCFESLVRSDAQDASAYVLMASTYADAGRWTDADAIESLRKSVGASKKPAESGIEVNRHVHTFVVGEEKADMSSKLGRVHESLKQGGHVFHTELVLKPAPEKEKEDQLCGHAEKLALAYGLLNTPDGTPLLVTKNLRMCGDCHSATQIMSRVERREIIVRDAHRLHRFAEGSCSCGGRP